MRVEGTANINNYNGKAEARIEIQPQKHVQEIKEVKPSKEERKIENIATLELAHQIVAASKGELPISDKVMIEAIDKANKAIIGTRREFEYSVHKPTHAISIKVIDSESKEVIREIPPEKMLDLVAKLWELAGIIVDEKR